MTSGQSGRFRKFANSAMMVLVLATCLGVWFRPGLLANTAKAQIPDAGLQRKKLLEAAERTNQLLEEIKAILESHTATLPAPAAEDEQQK